MYPLADGTVAREIGKSISKIAKYPECDEAEDINTSMEFAHLTISSSFFIISTSGSSAIMVILLPQISLQLSRCALSLEFNLGNCITSNRTYFGIPLCCFSSSFEKYNQAANSCYNKHAKTHKPDVGRDRLFYFKSV